MKADLAMIDGISGHADRDGLAAWLNAFEKKPARVFLNHGEASSVDHFAKFLKESFGWRTEAPYSGAVFDLLTARWIRKTKGVPVLGYGTDELPAFYTRESGLGVDYRADTPEELAAFFRAERELGYPGGMLVGNPIPAEYAMDRAVIDAAIETALADAKAQGVRGKETTPFLLARVVELTGGESLESNIRLVLNNAQVAARTAVCLSAK